MRLKVAADKMRRARVGDDDIKYFFADDVVFVELGWRQTQSLAGDMGAEGLATRRTSAEIHPMATTDGKAEQLGFEEDRHCECDVVDVRPTLVRVVQNNDISRLHLIDREFLNRGVSAVLHRSQMHRVAGLADQAKVGVIDSVREIEHVGEDRRKRRALHDRRHARAGIFECIAQHLESDRVEGVLRRAPCCIFLS